MAMLQSLVEQTVMQKLSHSKQLLKKWSSSDVSTIMLPDEKIFKVVTPKNSKNHQLYATAATKKKDIMTKPLHTWSTFRHQSSVGESQMVEKTHVWYSSVMKSRLLRAVIVTQCCYKSYCVPCIRSSASSSSFSGTVLGMHGAWGSQLSYR